MKTYDTGIPRKSAVERSFKYQDFGGNKGRLIALGKV
jgi:hypothetical protein